MELNATEILHLMGCIQKVYCISFGYVQHDKVARIQHKLSVMLELRRKLYPNEKEEFIPFNVVGSNASQ